MNTIPASELFAVALVGYQAQLKAIDEKIQEIRSELRGQTPSVAVVANGPTPAPIAKRTMSPSARRRIAAAQRKRWAAYHKEQDPTAPAKKAKAKRVLSPAAKRRISEATKKRWAAYRAAKAKAA